MAEFHEEEKEKPIVSEIPPFKCEHCERIFGQKKTMTKHIETIHFGKIIEDDNDVIIDGNEITVDNNNNNEEHVGCMYWSRRSEKIHSRRLNKSKLEPKLEPKLECFEEE